MPSDRSPAHPGSSLTVPEPVVAAIDAWLAAHDEHCNGLVEGLYIVGSVALGDWKAGRSDIDIVAVTAEAADPETAGYLHTAHAVVRELMPDVSIDGPYVSWADLAQPASTGVMRPWTVDGEWRYDGECFEVNPVVWRMLRRHAVRVSGPRLDHDDPGRVAVADDDEELRAFLTANLRTYWSEVRREFVGAIGELSDGGSLPAHVVEWCVLGPARIHVTLETGEIVSKSEAARRLIPRLDDEPAVGLQIALECRSGERQQVDREDAVLAATALGVVLSNAISITR